MRSMNASDTLRPPFHFALRRRSIQPLGYKCASTTVDVRLFRVFVFFILSVVGGCCCLIVRRLFAAAAAAADDMECRPLKVKVISARDLRDVRLIFDMNPYVVASLFRDGRHSNEQRTPAHRDGGTSPRWDHALAKPFTVHVAAARFGLLTLKLKIKTERTLGDRDIGTVDVPVRELLEQGGDGWTKAMSCAVSTGGVLEFSYRFGDSFTLLAAPTDQPSGNQQPPGAGVGSRGGPRIGDTIGAVVDVVDTVVGILNT